MKILICLSNVLLGKALLELLARNVPGCQIAAAKDFCVADGFQPDVVMVDARNLTQDPMTRCHDAKIILIDTGLEPDELINLLLTYRLDGVIDRYTDVALFKKALKAIVAGQLWIDNGKMRAILDQAKPQGKNHQADSLSRKEQEIVMLISQGLRNRDIAAKLYISEQTVKTHISSIFKKAHVSRRSQLAPLALTLRISNII
jgi:DNA-binding NarL/FixJ family response regulator